VLRWTPHTTSTDALLQLIDGIRHRIGGPSPVLRPAASGVGRVAEAVRTVARGGPGARS
jgi:hypothetical protein